MGGGGGGGGGESLALLIYLNFGPGWGVWVTPPTPVDRTLPTNMEGEQARR